MKKTLCYIAIILLLLLDWRWAEIWYIDLLFDFIAVIIGIALAYSYIPSRDKLNVQNLPSQMLKQENHILKNKIKTLETALDKSLNTEI